MHIRFNICTSASDQINFLIQFTDRAFHFGKISVISYMHMFVLTDVTILALILHLPLQECCVRCRNK